MVRLAITLIFCFQSNLALAKKSKPEDSENLGTRGIYVNEGSLFAEKKLNMLLEKSKNLGINTFVVDFHRQHSSYPKLMAYIRGHQVKIIARIVVFPGGGKPWQVVSQDYLKSRIELASFAKGLGVNSIQLDYIRYSTKQIPGPGNSIRIHNVIKKFRKVIGETHLQVAVFGEALRRESLSIGQNIPLFAKTVDSIAPMLYPSHYRPYHANSQKPYKTVFGSLQALKKQFQNKIPIEVVPYFEMYNIRNPSTNPLVRRRYIAEQIRAIADSKAQGWIAWSANNRYHHLFKYLRLKRALLLSEDGEKD